MKSGVFLRHASTKLYYTGWQSWSTEMQQAQDFGAVEAAIERARREMLSQMEVVTKREDSEEERVQPIADLTKW